MEDFSVHCDPLKCCSVVANIGLFGYPSWNVVGWERVCCVDYFFFSTMNESDVSVCIGNVYKEANKC